MHFVSFPPTLLIPSLGTCIMNERVFVRILQHNLHLYWNLTQRDSINM